jgi:hypothetical protein
MGLQKFHFFSIMDLKYECDYKYKCSLYIMISNAFRIVRGNRQIVINLNNVSKIELDQRTFQTGS